MKWGQLRREAEIRVGAKEKGSDWRITGWQDGVGGGCGHLGILIEPFGDPGFISNWGRGGAVNLTECSGNWLSGGRGRFRGKGKNGSLEVVDGS